MGALTSLLLYPFSKGYNILSLSEYRVGGKELRDLAWEQAGPSEVCRPFPPHRFESCGQPAAPAHPTYCGLHLAQADRAPSLLLPGCTCQPPSAAFGILRAPKNERVEGWRAILQETYKGPSKC